MSSALPWAILALLAVAVLVALAWRRGGPLAGLATLLGATVVGLATRVLTMRRPTRAPSTPEDVHRAREAHRARAREALREAERAREAAERIAADVDTAGDAEALVEHLTRRSEEG